MKHPGDAKPDGNQNEVLLKQTKCTFDLALSPLPTEHMHKRKTERPTLNRTCFGMQPGFVVTSLETGQKCFRYLSPWSPKPSIQKNSVPCVKCVGKVFRNGVHVNKLRPTPSPKVEVIKTKTYRTYKSSCSKMCLHVQPVVLQTATRLHFFWSCFGKDVQISQKCTCFSKFSTIRRCWNKCAIPKIASGTEFDHLSLKSAYAKEPCSRPCINRAICSAPKLNAKYFSYENLVGLGNKIESHYPPAVMICCPNSTL